MNNAPLNRDTFWQALQAGPPLIVAELSGNHGGSLSQALALVDAAAAAGAQAIKLQTFTADRMTLDRREGDFLIQDPDSLWAGRSLHDLYTEAQTPWEWHEALFRRAHEKGLFAFSSPFDADAVAFLQELKVPALKIASFELTDLSLVRCAAATGIPLILSTGMASFAEIEEAVDVALSAGCERLCLLQCTSRYPAESQHLNLRTISHLHSAFGLPIGFSDHSIGSAAAVAATALGACLIEKHLMLESAPGAIDAGFSTTPEGLVMLVTACREAHDALGRVCYGESAPDASERQYRRSLYIGSDLKAGTRLQSHHLRCVRPGGGLEPRYLERVLGRRLATDLAAGTPLNWENLEKGDV